MKQLIKNSAIDNSGGFSLISVIVSMTVSSILFSAILTMMNFQNKSSQSLSQKMETISLKTYIVQILSDPSKCACQLTPFTLDLSGGTIPDIDLITLRSTCDLTSLDNIIVDAGVSLKGMPGVTIDEVKISKIAYGGTGDTYLGDLVVTYNSSLRPLPPITIPLFFEVDSSMGSASARPISSCYGDDGESSGKCYYVDKDLSSGGKVLVGCGGTDEITSNGATALGYSAGKNSTGNYNTFVGFRTGEETTSGEENTFLGAKFWII